jgi:hypothetical protein
VGLYVIYEYALAFVTIDVVKEINNRQLTVLIITESDYNLIKSETIIDAKN